MVMVETGGDRGHVPARATYEAEGFVRWPVARYFKDLAPQGTDDAGGEDVRGSRRTANVPNAGYTMCSSGYSGFHIRS